MPCSVSWAQTSLSCHAMLHKRVRKGEKEKKAQDRQNNIRENQSHLLNKSVKVTQFVTILQSGNCSPFVSLADDIWWLVFQGFGCRDKMGAAINMSNKSSQSAFNSSNKHFWYTWIDSDSQRLVLIERRSIGTIHSSNYSLFSNFIKFISQNTLLRIYYWLCLSRKQSLHAMARVDFSFQFHVFF